MSARSDFFGKDYLDHLIQETESSLNVARSSLESENQLREELNGPLAKNEAWAGAKHRTMVDECIKLAGLKHAAGASVDEVRSLFREAATAFLRIAQASDFRVGVSEPMMDSPRRIAKKFGSRPGVVKVEEYVDERTGQKMARLHSIRQPASLIFTRSLEAALISGDANLATAIAETYPYTSLNDGAILRFFVLGKDQEAVANKEVFEPWASGDKDGDWPYPRRQFPSAILAKDNSMLTDGLEKASKAFTSRWKASRYQTPAMLKRLGTPENALFEGKKFLVNMKWVLYTHGLAFSIVAARRGLKDFQTNEAGWSEWIPRELVVAAV